MELKAACVIGWPVEHSRSPLIHTYWLRQLGITADYRREAVPPDRLAEFVAHLGDRGYVGANVTVPHKEAVMRLSRPDALAQAVGAANTLWFEDGVLRATNTDVEGFVASLDAAVPAWSAGLDTFVSSTAASIALPRCGRGSATPSCRPPGRNATTYWRVPDCW